MKIHLTIFTPKNGSPEKVEYTGNYAVETMLIKTTEKYFGKRISEKLENILKTRVDE